MIIKKKKKKTYCGTFNKLFSSFGEVLTLMLQNILSLSILVSMQKRETDIKRRQIAYSVQLQNVMMNLHELKEVNINNIIKGRLPVLGIFCYTAKSHTLSGCLSGVHCLQCLASLLFAPGCSAQWLGDYCVLMFPPQLSKGIWWP